MAGKEQKSQVGALLDAKATTPRTFFDRKGLPYDPVNDSLALGSEGMQLKVAATEDPGSYHAIDLLTQSDLATQLLAPYQIVHLYLPQAQRFDRTTHPSDMGVHVFGVVLDKPDPSNLLDDTWRFMINAIHTTGTRGRMVVTVDPTKVLPDELHAYSDPSQHAQIMRDIRAFAASGVEVRANAMTACGGLGGAVKRKLDHQLPIQEVVRLSSPGAEFLLKQNGTKAHDIRSFDLGKMHRWVHANSARRRIGADVYAQFSPQDPRQKGEAEFYTNVLVVDGRRPVSVVLNPYLNTLEGIRAGELHPVFVDGQALEDARRAKLYTTLQTPGAEDNLAVLVDKATKSKAS